MALTTREIYKWHCDVHHGDLAALKEKYASNRSYLDSLSNLNYGGTALHEASWRGYLEMVEWLISKGANTNIKDHLGRIPLHWAVDSNHLDVIKILVSNGAYLNTKDKYRRTALHYGFMGGYTETVQYLLTEGAYTNIKNDMEKTPREMAIDDKTRKVFDSFRPSLVYLCLQTLHRAHTDQQQSFVLSQKELNYLPRHLSAKLVPYITI